MIEIGDKVLVTVDNWFYAPDGQTYKGVHGTLKGVKTAEATLGIRPNGKSTNWYLEIGNVVIAGCQVHYAVKCDSCEQVKCNGWTTNAESGIKEYEYPSPIYFTD